MKLVIVESPTKAKTISKFLGHGYKVMSSFGHVKDLPKNDMGIAVEDGTFTPRYIVPRDKAKLAKELKAAAEKADDIYFATDEDREGEAISWHLAELFHTPTDEAKRLVFHEITPTAIKAALAHPRPLIMNLVNAQQARRVLDRLVGYELSPLLWKKIARGLSAGRVQSVALRLVVEREEAIKQFKPEEYWTIKGVFSPGKKEKEQFEAELEKINGKKLAKFDLPAKKDADAVLTALEDASYHVAEIETATHSTAPAPPFRTSTLQQEANQRLGYSSKQTMRLAQQLYEGVEIGEEGPIGLITYMRTDSVNLSEQFLEEARAFIFKEMGKEYVAEKPRVFANKTKGAQEAHEAIRPTDPSRTPLSVKAHLTPQQYKLYDLIWRRATATQMKEALLNKTTVRIDSEGKDMYTFRASGQTILFDGFLKLYPEKIKEEIIPTLKEKEVVRCHTLHADQHFTEAPARYSDATLVKALEEYGIGRPSTYAPTIATIEERGYVVRDVHKRMEPTDTGMVVNELLTTHFPTIVDLAFTAKMEEELDDIAEGKKEWQPMIRAFYEPFKKLVDEKQHTLKKEVKIVDAVCPECGKPLVERFGRFGKFIACSGYPACKFTEKNNNGTNGENAAPPVNKPCPECGKPLVARQGRYGSFIGCSGYPACKYIERQEKVVLDQCPACGKGKIVERRSKRGKPFYSCSEYPACTYALWQRPTGEYCSQCKAPLTFKNKTTIQCSNKECGFEKQNPD